MNLPTWTLLEQLGLEADPAPADPYRFDTRNAGKQMNLPNALSASRCWPSPVLMVLLVARFPNHDLLAAPSSSRPL